MSNRLLRAAQSTTKLAAKLRRRLKQREEQNILKSNVEVDRSHRLESMIAGSFLRNNASSFDAFQRHLDQVNESNLNKLNELGGHKSKEDLFPYDSAHMTTFSVNAEMENKQKSEAIPLQGDRGFFVKGDTYCDEYTEATTTNILEDEHNEFSYVLGGSTDAVELVEMRAPHQGHAPNTSTPLGKLEDLNLSADEWKMEYGKEDPSFKLKSNIPCSGCGAKLHCHDSALPGFVPVELLERTIQIHRRNKRGQLNELCRRCYMLKKHDFLLNINVSPVDYAALMGHLKLMQEALVLLIVDMTDIRGSIHKQLPDIIGDKKPMIVIGNKVDLLPPDAKMGYLKRFRNVLHDELKASGFMDRFNVLDVSLVSAKTGYGVEDLISSIYLKWTHLKGGLRGDVYVVGCTNAGKSTLFNAFLQSDLCKVRAIDLVERVTTSIWPGTTLSLLKFPVMTPTARRLELRRRRLLTNKAWTRREAHFQHELFKETDDPKYLTLMGNIESTFKEEDLDSQPLTKEEIEKKFEGTDVSESVAKRTKTLRLDAKEFVEGSWCYDTPGTVNTDQILDLLTLDELIKVIPRTLIVPRTFVCNAGETLLIGGLGRIDVSRVYRNEHQAEGYGIRSIYLTVFASKSLPVYVVTTKNVNRFLRKRLGTEILGAPIGSAERLEKLPPMESQTFTIMSKGSFVIARLQRYPFVFNRMVSTPGGRGIGFREPLLPHAFHMKGSRIPGTAEYNQKIFAPEIEKRKKQRV
ncbi:Nitric oxide-associated protein 1 [Aphelenchoides bicaudatus]|nr:Nitric oxide-associated protein 1 [Aphelenchoides bicaudatus]